MTIQVYDTHELLKVVPTLFVPSQFWTNRCFPTVHTSTDEYINFDELSRGRRMAPFVSPMAQGKVMKQEGFSTKRFKPAYIKPKFPVTPNHVIKRVAGEALTGSLSPAQREGAIIADLMRDGRYMIERRWEWMSARAAIDGKVTVSGEDYPTVEVDFGRDATHTITLTSTALWTDKVNSTPNKNIEAWQLKIQRKSGKVVNDVIMGVDAWAAYIAHPETQNLLETRRGSLSAAETGPAVLKDGEPILRGTFGNFRVWTYQDIYEDDTGAVQEMMDQTFVVMADSGIEGVRAFGAIMDRKAGYAAMPIFPKMFEQDDPSVLYLLMQSAPLMIPTRPNASLRAKVV